MQPLARGRQDYPTTTATTADSANGSSSYQNPHMDGLWCPEGQYSAYGTLFLTPAGVSLKEVLHLGQTVDNPNQFEWGALASYSVFVFFDSPCPTDVPYREAPWSPSHRRRLLWQTVRQNRESRAAERRERSSGLSHLAHHLRRRRRRGSPVRRLQDDHVHRRARVGDLRGAGANRAADDRDLLRQGSGRPHRYGAVRRLHCPEGRAIPPEDEISYEQKMIAEKLDVQEVMTSDLVCLPPLPTVGHVVRILKTYKHNAFPCGGRL